MFPENTTPLPFVTLCTPTFNRVPFFEMISACVRHQTYPKTHYEWIILDDGTDPIEPWIPVYAADLAENIRYIRLPHKMTLGAKRNHIHTQSRGDILVYFDDDDYYPPTRIQHAVQSLMSNPTYQIAGAATMDMYYTHLQDKIGLLRTNMPPGQHRATAATFAFRRQLLETCRYDDTHCIAEEMTFLRNYTIPMIQLDPQHTVLVLAHSQNTVDKYKLLNHCPLENSPLTLQNYEGAISWLPFFQSLKTTLATYDAGDRRHKPQEMAAFQRKFQPTRIQFQTSKGETMALTEEELMLILQRQHEWIRKHTEQRITTWGTMK